MELQERAQKLFRIQGGIFPNRSKKYLKVVDNKLFCPATSKIYIGDMDHMTYFMRKRLGIENINDLPQNISDNNIEVVEMFVPHWFSYIVEKYAVSQFDSKNTIHPKLVDKTTPGKSYQLHGSWSKILECSCYKANVHQLQTKESVFDFLLSTPKLHGNEEMQDAEKLPFYLMKAQLEKEDLESLQTTWGVNLDNENDFIR